MVSRPLYLYSLTDLCWWFLKLWNLSDLLSNTAANSKGERGMQILGADKKEISVCGSCNNHWAEAIDWRVLFSRLRWVPYDSYVCLTVSFVVYSALVLTTWDSFRHWTETVPNYFRRVRNVLVILVICLVLLIFTDPKGVEHYWLWWNVEYLASMLQDLVLRSRIPDAGSRIQAAMDPRSRSLGPGFRTVNPGS